MHIDHSLIDHHVHSVTIADLDLGALGGYLAETANVAADAGHLFGPLGLAIRRWCPPILGLEPFCDWPTYIERRNELGSAEATRLLLAASNVDHLMIDSGFRSDELCSSELLAEMAGATFSEITRVETVAEQARQICPPSQFWDLVEQQIRSSSAVGLKSVIAYRCGFRPLLEAQLDQAALADATERWYATGQSRLVDPMIEAHLVHLAATIGADLGWPLQLHVGLGDTDLTLHDVNPTLLTNLIRQHPACTFTLLHCWPFERDAAYLAGVFTNVVLDVGLALNHMGPSALAAMNRSLEFAPFSRILYSSDAFGVGELHLAGAQQFRWALGKTLDTWIADDACSSADAEAIVQAVAVDNAKRIYTSANL